MNKERELLREIYADLEYDSKLPLWLRDRVRDCLSSTSDDAEEPVYQLSIDVAERRVWLDVDAEIYEAETQCAKRILHPTKPAKPLPSFLTEQEPLGEDFSRILNKHRWDLYERGGREGQPKPAEPKAKPVLYIKEQELLYIQVLKQEGLAQEWKSNLGFVKEAGDVGLYLHPPKPAESEAETIETLQAENFKLASGQCTEGGPWGDEGGTPYCKYAARKPMTEEEIGAWLDGLDCDEDYCVPFYAGIRFAEKHHDITDADV